MVAISVGPVVSNESLHQLHVTPKTSHDHEGEGEGLGYGYDDHAWRGGGAGL
jgi:hypothetical protein